ncbi:MAG: hypothetical protein Tsb0013_18590 [Phycisphaerales bacterium]
MKRILALWLVVCAQVCMAQESGSEDPFVVVERYLADLELDELRAEYLEDRLDALGGQERLSVARRLADVYARMLRDAPDSATRIRLEAKATALLESIPQAESDDLRLSLARAGFERAEAVLERWRVRAVGGVEADGALRSMRSLMREFERMGVEAHKRVELLESREERARDADLPMIEERIRASIERRSTAFYLAGWAGRYLAEFEDRAVARDARVAFGWLLNAPLGDEPQLDRVPEGYERLPHVALAMLCVSFTHAVEGRTGLADAWYARVAQSDALAVDVSNQLEIRRMITLGADGRWRDARSLLEALEPDDARLVLIARLASVLACDAIASGNADSDTRALRDAGFAALVARGELGQVVDVVDAFGVRTIDAGGFVGGLVRGVIDYQRAREAHREAGNDTEPATDPALIERYTGIADRLVSVVNDPQADANPEAWAGAVLVLGMCRFYANDYERASSRFVEAADLGRGTPAEADALWMAIIAGDRAGARSEQQESLIDRFLEAFPDHPRASRLAMRRALERDDDPERSIEMLLSVAPDDPAYESARRQAARLAYQQAVSAPVTLASAYARRFLVIAEPLLAMDRRRAVDDTGAAERATTTARRILDVAMRQDPPDTARAARAFDALQSMIEEGLTDPDPIAGELLFRKAEYALAIDDVEAAERHLDELQQVDPELASQGDRLVWRDALRAWRRVRESGTPERVTAMAQRVVRIGARLIDQMDAPERALRDEVNASVYRSVAQAGADLWRTERDADARALAERLYASLIEHSGASRDVLEGYVEMARAGGNNKQALEAQRRLVAGLEPGSRAWFGARTLQLEILAEVDPERARTALRQHAALYPELAPAPWAERLRALGRKLRVVLGGAP